MQQLPPAVHAASHLSGLPTTLHTSLSYTETAHGSIDLVVMLQVAVAEQLLAGQLHSGLACGHHWAAQAVQVTYMHMQQISPLSQRHANNDSLDPVLPLLYDACDAVSSLLTLLACPLQQTM